MKVKKLMNCYMKRAVIGLLTGVHVLTDSALRRNYYLLDEDQEKDDMKFSRNNAANRRTWTLQLTA